MKIKQFKYFLISSFLGFFILNISSASSVANELEKEDWESIEGTAYLSTEGVFKVNEVRGQNKTAQIGLNYRIIHGKRRDRFVFFLQGGPGISNLTGRFSDQLLKDFSIVELGYRGIDSSTSLECDRYDDFILARPLITDGQRKRLAQVFADCLDDYRKQGINPQGYGLHEVIEDIEDFRKFLGVEIIHFFAVSYGTRISLQYMTRYPDHSGPSVLIGANPKGHFFWAKKDLSPIYNAYERYISDQLPPHPNGLEGLMAETLKNAPNRAWGIKIDRDRIRVVTHALLFHVKTAPLLLDAYLKAYEDQDYKGLALLSLAYNFVFPRIFQWGDFTFKALTEDFDPARDYLSESQPLAGEIGSPISELFFTAPLGNIISNLEMPKLEPIQITTPTLILSGELDFSTPPKIATKKLVDPFAAVHQVIVPGLGHVDDFIAQPGPTFQLASQWMNSATLGKVAFQSPPIQLHKTIGIGEALPIGLVVVFLVIGLVVGGVWWFIRKLKGN